MVILGVLSPHFLQDYDKFSHDRRGRDATRKLLLSPSSHHNSHHGGDRRGNTNGTSTAMFQPPPTDIYLCDKCESEFYSLREVQTHERQCCGDKPPSPAVPSPEPEPVEDDPQPDAQVPFLAYFKLRPAEHTGLTPYTSPRKRTSSSPPRRFTGPLYPRYESVPLTSPLGKYLFANSKFRNKYQASQHSVMKYERHLPATPNTDINFKERCHNRWLVVWRGRKEQPPWVHLYCFNRAQRRDRTITITTGLDLHSRRLLRLCRSSTVKLKRLQKRLVDRLQRLGGPSAPCIDLTEEAHLDPSLALSTHLPLHSLLNPMTLGLDGCGAKAASMTPSGVLQWMSGLPQVSTNTYLPGASGIMTPATLTSRLAAQLALPSPSPTPAPTPPHETPLSIISVAPTDTHLHQHQHPLHPGVAQKMSMAHYSTKTLLSQSLSMSAGSLFAKPGTSLSADISLIPLNSIKSTSNYRASSDVMKPLSRKRFAINDPQLHFSQKTGVSEQKRGEIRTSIGDPGTLRYDSSGHHHPTPSPSHNNSVKGGSDMYTHLVPQWDANTNLLGNSVTLSDLTQARMNSSIEIIDLSSDEDDLGRGRGRSEADNAPQQLDGLACYPHTGAKVPDSSQYSSSKNGNSHWSSKQKSRCGTGRGGDLATNGRSPNVPPSIEGSPVPKSSFLPTPTPIQGPKTKGNSRKRKRESGGMSPHGGKTIILDISKLGVKVTEDQVAAVSTQPLLQDSCTSLHEDNYSNPVCAEVLPTTPEDISNIHSTLDLETSHLRASEQIGAFENPKNAYESSKMFIVDEDISFKSPLHIDEDISFNGSPPNYISEGLYNFKESGKQTELSAQDNLPSGFITNIFNTVSKGIKFFKSIVGTGSSSDSRYTSVDALTLKEYNAAHNVRRSLPGFKMQERSTVYKEVRGSKSLPNHRQRISSEVVRLLKDECRELRLNGLTDLRGLDVENVKVTRRSVERFMPGKTLKKNLGCHRLRYRNVEVPSNNLSVKIRNSSNKHINNTTNVAKDAKSVSVMLHKDSYSSCMDENGNSASYLTLSSDRQSVEKSQNSTLVQKINTGVLSESNRAPSDCDVEKGQANVNYDINGRGKKLMIYNSDTIVKSTVFSDISRGNEASENRSSSNSKGNTGVTNINNKYDILGTDTHCSANKGEWETELLQDFYPTKVGQVKESSDKSFSHYFEISSPLYNEEAGSGRKFHSSHLFLCHPGNTPSKHMMKYETNRRRTDVSRRELTGETAEECGAWQAQFPPSQAPLGSSTSTPKSKSARPLLLHSMKKSPISLTLTTQIDHQPPPPSSSQYIRKRKKQRHKQLSRELSNLATDEWKEIKNSGFHPSDLVGTEELRYFNASSDEEDLCPSSTDPKAAPQQQQPSLEKKIKSSNISDLNRKLSTKLSREVARLLKDECKELRGPRGKMPKARAELLRQVNERSNSNQPNGLRNVTMISRSSSALGSDACSSSQRPDSGGGSSGNMWPLMRSTRSQGNTVPTTDTITPRSSHRQILQAETAMCVLNYKLPNIN